MKKQLSLTFLLFCVAAFDSKAKPKCVYSEVLIKCIESSNQASNAKCNEVAEVVYQCKMAASDCDY